MAVLQNRAVAEKGKFDDSMATPDGLLANKMFDREMAAQLSLQTRPAKDLPMEQHGRAATKSYQN